MIQSAIDASIQIDNFTALKPGDRVLRKASDGGWKLASVEKVLLRDGIVQVRAQRGMKLNINDPAKLRLLKA